MKINHPNGDAQKQEVSLGGYYYTKTRTRKQLSEHFGLSTRETEAVSLLSQGNSIASTAKAMNVSKNTIETYRRRIFRKLGVKSAVNAASLVTAFYAGAEIHQK
ncbi:MAG: hypothetical protein Hens3KO_03260 [Henriciella sp.]